MLHSLGQEIFQRRQLVTDPLVEPVTTGNHPGAVALAADQLPEGVPDAAAHPWVVYAVVAAAVAYVLATAVAKVAEPISSALTKYREHRQASEDARIRDLDRQVDHLLGRVTTLELRQQRQDTFLAEHAAWDRTVLQAAIAAGLTLEDLGQPPPLWPPIE